MDKKPEALRLADAIDPSIKTVPTLDMLDAAAELRRLHEENEQLKKQLDRVNHFMDRIADVSQRLSAYASKRRGV